MIRNYYYQDSGFYLDRDGNEVPIPISNNSLVDFMFSHTITRFVMRFISAKWFANLERAIMKSFVSTFFITKFVRKNGIHLREYKKKKYTSFNDFFCREIKPESRPFTAREDRLLSPCDCKASVYKISGDHAFAIKGVPYTVGELFADSTEAHRYCGGYLFLLRLSLDDYHHYMYPISGEKTADVPIPGKLLTVHPLIHKYAAVYRENARIYSTIYNLDTKQYLSVMQVGALGVGKIVNDTPQSAYVKQGGEQGHFEFGGSTILVLVPEGSYLPSPDLLANTARGYETIVKMGERIGTLPADCRAQFTIEDEEEA